MFLPFLLLAGAASWAGAGKGVTPRAARMAGGLSPDAAALVRDLARLDAAILLAVPWHAGTWAALRATAEATRPGALRWDLVAAFWAALKQSAPTAVVQAAQAYLRESRPALPPTPEAQKIVDKWVAEHPRPGGWSGASWAEATAVAEASEPGILAGWRKALGLPSLDGAGTAAVAAAKVLGPLVLAVVGTYAVSRLWPRSQAPRRNPRSLRADRDGYTAFHWGRRPGRTLRLRAPMLRPGETAAEAGRLDAVEYTSDKADGAHRYRHEFGPRTKPRLAWDSVGGLHVLGGTYVVTEKGIEG